MRTAIGLMLFYLVAGLIIAWLLAGEWHPFMAAVMAVFWIIFFALSMRSAWFEHKADKEEKRVQAENDWIMQNIYGKGIISVVVLILMAGGAWAGGGVTADCKTPDCGTAALVIDPGPPMPEFEIDLKALDGMECKVECEAQRRECQINEICWNEGEPIHNGDKLCQLWCTPKEKPEPKVSCDKLIADKVRELVKVGPFFDRALMNLVAVCED